MGTKRNSLLSSSFSGSSGKKGMGRFLLSFSVFSPGAMDLAPPFLYIRPFFSMAFRAEWTAEGETENFSPISLREGGYPILSEYSQMKDKISLCFLVGPFMEKRIGPFFWDEKEEWRVDEKTKSFCLLYGKRRYNLTKT